MYSALHQLHEADEWHAVQCTESAHDDARKAVMEAACLEDEKENKNSECMISALYRAMHHQTTDQILFCMRQISAMHIFDRSVHCIIYHSH